MVDFSGVLDVPLLSVTMFAVSSLDLLEHLLSESGLSERDRLLDNLVLVRPGGGEDEGLPL